MPRLLLRTTAPALFLLLPLAMAAPAAADAPDCSTVSYNGSGTSGDPYQVGTVDQLQCIENQGLDAHYELTGDVDASETSSWNGGTGFSGFNPIGDDYNTQFTGSFDGNGYTISGLTIDRGSTRDVGLFGYIGSSAVVRNVGLDGGSVTGDANVGPLVGNNYDGTIEDSYATAAVSGSRNVGGLVGYNYGTVRRTFATGAVDVIVAGDGSSEFAGGLVGGSSGTIERSYATGTVNGNGVDAVGGLVGKNNGVGTVITRSYATGSVSGNTDVGGLVGRGGVNGATTTRSYWNEDVYGSSDAGTGLTTGEMQGSSASTNIDGLDFASTWDTVPAGGDVTADGYPVLSGLDRKAQLEAQGIYALGVSSITRSSPATQETNAASVDFEVSFSESVENVGTDDFTMSGSASGTADRVSSADGSIITVTVVDISGDGSLGLDLDASSDITDSDGNALSTSEPGTDETYTIDNTAPGFGSSSSAPVNEGTTGTILDVEAGDDGTASPDADVDYSLGGVDAAPFRIESNTGVISLDAPKNFENPSDSDSGNDYELTVTADDDVGNISTQNVTITVLDVDEARTIHVDASSGGDGSSWSSAFTSLQDALGTATGNDEIWIAEGTYTPDPSGTDKSKSFTITGDQDGLKIYGGFESGDAFTDRDPGDHPVALSGDIGGDDDPFAPNTDSDGDTSTPTQTDHLNGDNSDHVLVFDGGNRIGADVVANVTEATVLSGVTVTGGNADGSGFPDNAGGGLYCDGNFSGSVCSPTLRDVVFTGNSASFGGGAIYNGGFDGESSPAIINATFTGNSAGSDGGAVFNDSESDGASSPTITGATFTGNSAGSDGGAIFNDATTGMNSPQITNTILYGNTASGSANQLGAEDNPTPQVTYSLVEGGYSGTGNIDADPQFADASAPAGDDGTFATDDDGLRLTEGSPALDAGDNAALPPDAADLDGDTDTSEPVPFDLTGTKRIVDNDNDAATPAGVDLGAYEASPSTQLPVELASFEGATTETGVRLRWETASESGNAQFDIQRLVKPSRLDVSTEGRNWQTVGSVSGAGTTDQPQTYRFTDAELPYAADSVAYRLKQVDTDGTTHLSDPITIARSGPEQVELLGTYPNPARQRASVRYALPSGTPEETVRLRLYDVMGRQVRGIEAEATAGHHEQTLDVNGLASSVYILRLQAGGADVTRKLTVVR